jgi:hypothetical protein
MSLKRIPFLLIRRAKLVGESLREVEKWKGERETNP